MIRTLVLALLAVSLSHPSAARALTGPPTSPSLPAPPEPAVTAATDPGTNLDNGLRITLIPYGKERRATVRLAIEGGTAYEGPSETGLADVTARWMLHRSLSASPGALHLDVEVQPDVIVFSTEVAASAVPATLRRFGDLVSSTEAAVVDGAALDSARIAATRAYTSSPSPQADARIQLRRVLYGGTTYGSPPPPMQQVRSFTAADVRSYLNRYVSPDRTSLYVVGSFRQQDTRAAADRHLGDWSAEATGQALRVDAHAQERIRVIDRSNRSEVAIAMGTTVVGPGHEDYAALQVATQLIGGGHASRLAQTPGLATISSPYSLLDPHRASTYWAAVVTTRPTQTRPTLQTLRRTLTELRTTPPDTVAVRRAATVLIDRFLMQSSTRDGLSEQMMFLHRHDLSVDYFMTYDARIRSVTPGDVQRVINRYLSADQISVVVTGPARLIKPQIAPLENQVP